MLDIIFYFFKYFWILLELFFCAFVLTWIIKNPNVQKNLLKWPVWIIIGLGMFVLIKTKTVYLWNDIMAALFLVSFSALFLWSAVHGIRQKGISTPVELIEELNIKTDTKLAQKSMGWLLWVEIYFWVATPLVLAALVFDPWLGILAIILYLFIAVIIGFILMVFVGVNILSLIRNILNKNTDRRDNKAVENHNDEE